jgi:hypothetical protein
LQTSELRNQQTYPLAHPLAGEPAGATEGDQAVQRGPKHLGGTGRLPGERVGERVGLLVAQFTGLQPLARQDHR